MRNLKNNPLEYYKTPEHVVKQLWELTDNLDTSNLVIFDPCAGDGALCRGIKCKKLIQWDIEPKADDVEKHDALTEEFPEADMIVMNPPFNSKTCKIFREKASKYEKQLIVGPYRMFCKNKRVTKAVRIPGWWSETPTVDVCLLYKDVSKEQNFVLERHPVNVFLILLKQEFTKHCFKTYKDLGDGYVYKKVLVGSYPEAIKPETFNQLKQKVEKTVKVPLEEWFASNTYHCFIAIEKDFFENGYREWLNKLVDMKLKHKLYTPVFFSFGV